MPSEARMARDTAETLRRTLRPDVRIDICSGVARDFPPGRYTHGLPLYVPPMAECLTDRACQVARPDLIVVYPQDGVVELIVEFEIDTNPENLIANFVAPFMASEYRPKHEHRRYMLRSDRTVHILLACLEQRPSTPSGQAAIEKGHRVIDWLNKLSPRIAADSAIANACAIAGDDWTRMKSTFIEKLRQLSPRLFRAETGAASVA